MKVLIGLLQNTIAFQETTVRYLCTMRSPDQPASDEHMLNRRAWCGYTQSSNCWKVQFI